MDEIKPCPFCGSSNIAVGTMSGGDWLVCLDCESAGPFIRSGHPEDWNTRPIEDALRADLAQVHTEFEASKLENVEMCQQLRTELAQVRIHVTERPSVPLVVVPDYMAELAQARKIADDYSDGYRRAKESFDAEMAQAQQERDTERKVGIDMWHERDAALAELAQAQQRIAELEAGGWVSVKDRLPEEF